LIHFGLEFRRNIVIERNRNSHGMKLSALQTFVNGGLWRKLH